jgi:hypothetical protein
MKCKELADELELTAMQIGRTRRKLFPSCDKSTELSDYEVDEIRLYLGPQEIKEEETEPLGPQMLEGVVTYAMEGSRRIEVTIEEDGEFKRVPAFVPTQMNAKKLWLQRIPLECINYEGTNYYRHASLSDKTWGAMSQIFSNI